MGTSAADPSRTRTPSAISADAANRTHPLVSHASVSVPVRAVISTVTGDNVAASRGTGPEVGVSGDAQPGPPRSLADKLNGLFTRVLSPNGDEFTLEEVVSGIRQTAGPDGPTISVSYLWQLRKGLRTNPTLRHLQVLAAFFGVSLAYFLDEDAYRRIDDQLEAIALLRNQSVHRVASRAAGLSPGSLQAIAQMIESARRVEGLPNDGEPDGPSPEDPAGGGGG